MAGEEAERFGNIKNVEEYCELLSLELTWSRQAWTHILASQDLWKIKFINFLVLAR